MFWLFAVITGMTSSPIQPREPNGRFGHQAHSPQDHELVAADPFTASGMSDEDAAAWRMRSHRRRPNRRLTSADLRYFGQRRQHPLTHTGKVGFLADGHANQHIARGAEILHLSVDKTFSRQLLAQDFKIRCFLVSNLKQGTASKFH